MSVQYPLPSGGIEEIAVTSVFFLLAILAVVARFYCRFLQRKAVAIDDYLIVVSLIFAATTIAVGYALVLNGGVGLHMKDATEEQIAITLKLFVPAPLLWAISTSMVKLSILFFYISIFPMPNIRTAVYTIILLTIALVVAVIFESFLLCRPFAFTWDKTISGGVCGDTTQAYLSIAIVNLVIDFAVVFLPMPVLWKLRMPVGKKVVISGILALGLLICCLSAARIKTLLDLDPLDFTYTVVPDLIFGALEIELGIVNACLPILRPLVRKVFGSDTNILAGWSKKTKMGGSGSKPRGVALINDRSFERLTDGVDYPLQAVVTGPSSNELMGHPRGTALHGSEVHGPLHPGDIRFQKDFTISRTTVDQSMTAR